MSKYLAGLVGLRFKVQVEKTHDAVKREVVVIGVRRGRQSLILRDDRGRVYTASVELVGRAVNGLSTWQYDPFEVEPYQVDGVLKKALVLEESPRRTADVPAPAADRGEQDRDAVGVGHSSRMSALVHCLDCGEWYRLCGDEKSRPCRFCGSVR